MFKKFEQHFNRRARWTWRLRKKKTPLQCFRAKFAGMDFGDGIYRVFENKEIELWREIITEAYPAFEGRFEPFGYDWMGRCFALDLQREDVILLFEVGSGEVLDVPMGIVEFHNHEIPKHHWDCLESSLFRKWRRENKGALPHENCIGYKQPLFMGGEDTVRNLEEIDMDIYWSTISSLF